LHLFFSLLFRSAFFAVPLAMAAADPQPCATNAETRQLDFWLGDWSVTYPGMAGTASSTVEVTLDKCLVIERWDGGKSHRGENIFSYSADDASWHGMFTDNDGRVHVLSGRVASGSAEFSGSSRGPNGETVLNRVRIVRLSSGKVEQSWEKSTDNGKTWKIEFRGEYTRKNP